jgi:hypothetical protein
MPLDQTLSAITDGGVWLALPADPRKSSLVALKGLLFYDLANFFMQSLLQKGHILGGPS